ncbi:MAG: pyridoxal-phosphate dependent enzyme [Planctomycetes bacterium]|nr:pyridoxal-phosphate dependent enzyme [Planctomycetota bacterium]
MVTIDDVTAAAIRIHGLVHRTPVMTSATLDREVGASVFLKCENLQKVGAFKARGACNAVLALDDDAARRGVVAHSSGNHAAALAYAARARGIPCTVVMPDSAPAVKVAAVRGYGARIVFCKAAERERVCAEVQRESGAVPIHPFENPFVIAGQGTAALELFDDIADLDVVVTPVGGGGLCAGTAIVARARGADIEVLAAEPIAVDDAARSLATGVLQPRVENAESWADGLMTGLGAPDFELMRRCGVRVVTVEEDQILAAARFCLERLKIVVEPSAATAVAAVRASADDLAGKRVGVILSGGNTDFRWLDETRT